MTRHAIAVLFALASFWSLSASAIEIKGVVRDVDGNGLSGATIRVYFRDAAGVLRRRQVTSKVANPATVKPVGYYEVDIPSDNSKTIQAIEYDHPNWHSGVVNSISRRNTHDGEINIALLLRDGPKTFPLILRQIRDYEALYYIEQQYLESLAEADANAALVEAPANRYYDRIGRLPNPRLNYTDEHLQQEIMKELADEQTSLIRRELDELYDLYGMEKPSRIVGMETCVPVRGCFGRVRYVKRAYYQEVQVPFEPNEDPNNVASGYRTWQDASGRTEVARLIRADEDYAYFLQENGRLSRARIRALIPSDQEVVRTGQLASISERQRVARNR